MSVHIKSQKLPVRFNGKSRKNGINKLPQSVSFGDIFMPGRLYLTYTERGCKASRPVTTKCRKVVTYSSLYTKFWNFCPCKISGRMVEMSGLHNRAPNAVCQPPGKFDGKKFSGKRVASR